MLRPSGQTGGHLGGVIGLSGGGDGHGGAELVIVPPERVVLKLKRNRVPECDIGNTGDIID